MTPMSITIYNAYANEVYLNKVEEVVKIKWIYNIAHSIPTHEVSVSTILSFRKGQGY